MAVKTILLRGKQFAVRKELVAAAAITPGHLVERDVNGKAAVHSTAGGQAARQFAFENELFGKGIDDAYAANDQVLIECPPNGAEIFALVPANAPAIVIGDYLESNGDGAFRLAKAGVGARATVTIGAADAAVTFLANQVGSEGNDITVEYIAGTAAAETVVVTGNAIVIKSDTTTPGTTDQADDIIALVNGDAQASALVVADEGAGDGTDAVVTPVAATNLAGGVDSEGGSASIIARAIEAVDNSAGGTPARIKIELL